MVQPPHLWDLSPSAARALQRKLAGQVRLEGDAAGARLIAGVDISTGPRGSNVGRAAVALLEWPSLAPVEQSVYRAPVRFPYVPGLLSFRELPLVLPAFERLRQRPDLVVVDGQGVAHPRRFGIACHLGVLLDLPTIGCAKSRLAGQPVGELARERGASVPLVDRGETVGFEVRTRDGVKPLYVSPGHRMTVEAATRWILDLLRGYRLPEPTRLAHNAAAGLLVAPHRTEASEG